VERDSRRPDRAIEALSQAVTLNPAFVAAREELAALDLSLGRRRDGLEQLEALAALEPDRPERLTDLALANARAGRFESAALAMQRAAERYPDSALVHRAVARIWLDFAEDGTDHVAVENALGALRNAATQDSGSPELQLLRGRAQLLSNDSAAAEQSLQAATASVPVEPAAFQYLAIAAERLGHHDLARVSRARYEALSD
jgi:Flp pilus assembly protein TadD